MDMDDFDLWKGELGPAVERRAEWGAFWDRTAPAVWFVAIVAVVLYAASTVESAASV